MLLTEPRFEEVTYRFEERDHRDLSTREVARRRGDNAAGAGQDVVIEGLPAGTVRDHVFERDGHLFADR